MIGVRNNDGHELIAKYDGKEYVFAADSKVTTPISEDAARHIFGYGERDKTRALLRLGWLPNGAQLQEGLARLGNFQFLQVDDIKFKEPEKPDALPRQVAQKDGTTDMPLSKEELALAHQDGATKKFGKP